MAVFRAYQATDMGNDLWGGVVVERGRTSIVATDGNHVGTFGGLFQYPDSGVVGTVDQPFDPGFLDPFGLGPVSGTIASYSQTRGILPQFAISQIEVSAGPVFHAVRFGDIHLANALVFARSDLIVGSRSADILIGYGGGDTIVGNAGNDRLFGDLGGDNLYGGDGQDRLSGGQGIDRLYGNDGNDRLLGGSQRDFLFGGDGRDVLTGNQGSDSLTGGGDADSFRFLSIADSPAGSNKRDTIQDFTHGSDRIDLRAVDGNAEEPGHQPFHFIGAAPFTDSPGELRYTQSSHLLEGDSDGDGKADFQIALTHGPVLTGHDLLL
ncbi:MAG: calcium-binding protein [Amaricoccus sp.]